MVFSDHYLKASEVGIAQFWKGGNAIDATVADKRYRCGTHQRLGNIGGGDSLYLWSLMERRLHLIFGKKAPSAAKSHHGFWWKWEKDQRQSNQKGFTFLWVCRGTLAGLLSSPPNTEITLGGTGATCNRSAKMRFPCSWGSNNVAVQRSKMDASYDIMQISFASEWRSGRSQANFWKQARIAQNFGSYSWCKAEMVFFTKEQ